MSIYAPRTKNKSNIWKTASKKPHHFRVSSISLFFYYIVKPFLFIVGCIDRNKLLPYSQCKLPHLVIKNHPKQRMCCTILPQSFKSGSFPFSARLLAQSIPTCNTVHTCTVFRRTALEHSARRCWPCLYVVWFLPNQRFVFSTKVLKNLSFNIKCAVTSCCL